MRMEEMRRVPHNVVNHIQSLSISELNQREPTHVHHKAHVAVTQFGKDLGKLLHRLALALGD